MYGLHVDSTAGPARRALKKAKGRKPSEYNEAAAERAVGPAIREARRERYAEARERRAASVARKRKAKARTASKRRRK